MRGLSGNRLIGRIFDVVPEREFTSSVHFY